MKREDYNDFYNIVIVKCMEDIQNKIEELGCSLDCVKKKDDKIIFERIFKYYQSKRDYVRSNYMSKRTNFSLDRHKVSSCMAYAILKTKPYKVNRNLKDLPMEILMINEYLAVYVAINILEMYRLDASMLGFEIIVPKTYHEEDEDEKLKNNSYICNLCKSLYYLSMSGIDKFDIFAYSNIFFLLEKYTDVYTQMKQQTENSIL